jgi:hypothetical protein
MTMLLKPTVLILGATGQIGRFILETKLTVNGPIMDDPFVLKPPSGAL